MKEQIIQLEPHDDVVTTLDKLGWLRTQRVLLVLPEGRQNRILQRQLDLVLIQRELTRRRAEWAIITDDPRVTDHASELGIPTFLSIADSRLERWRSQPASIAIRRDDRPQAFDSSRFAQPANRRQATEADLSRRFLSRISLGTALLALLALAYVIVPSATVTLAPATNQVNVVVPVVADPELAAIDFDNAAIPARIVGVEVEDTATVETTGTKDIPSLRATGIVAFINQAPEETSIPAGTVVRTTAGNPVRFVTTAPAILEARVNATTDAPVEAVEPGVSGNLPSNLINSVEGPLASRVRVINSAPTRGGDIQQVPAVSQEDYARLRAALLQQLQQRAYAEMTQLVAETEFIVTESLAVVLVQDETYDRFVGEEADSVGLEMRVVVQGVIIDERNARQVALNELAQKVGPSFAIGESTLIFRRGEVTSVDPERRVTFLMQGGGDVAVAIDSTQVQQLVRGARLAEAQFLLEQELPLRQAPVIEIRPWFLGHLPLLTPRIQVEIVRPA